MLSMLPFGRVRHRTRPAAPPSRCTARPPRTPRVRATAGSPHSAPRRASNSHHLVRKLDADGLLRLVGRSRRYAASAPRCPAHGRRDSFSGSVRNTSSAAPATWPHFKRLRQRLFHDQFAARAVDDADALLHDGNRGRVDDALGLRRQTHVQRQIIRLRLKSSSIETSVTLFSRAIAGEMNGS